MSRGQKALALVVLGVVATIVCFFLFAGVFVLGESASARVVDHVLIPSSSGGHTCAPVVEYEHGGESIQARSRIATSEPCPDIGETVQVYFWSEKPDDPTPLRSGVFLPLLAPLALFAAAAWVGLRRARSSELLAEAQKATVAGAADGALVKVRGRIDVAPDSTPLRAPLTDRECVACWTRVVRRQTGKPDERVHDDSQRVAFVVAAEDGEVRVAADMPQRLAIDADARGDVEMSPSPALDAYLAERGLPPAPTDPGDFHVWYQGVFVPGEEVWVVGKAKRLGPDAIELVGTEREQVVLEHVDRDERKRAMPKS